MKGLLIKDFMILKSEKSYFAIGIIIIVGMMFFVDEFVFPIGFSMFFFSIFAMNTIGFDTLDNGTAFLMTLPVSRSDYAKEKYVLGLILSGTALVLAGSVALIAARYKGTYTVEEILFIVLTFVPATVLLQAVAIPIQIKFGREKGAIAILAVIAVFFMSVKIVGIIVRPDVDGIIASLAKMNTGVLFALIYIAAGVLMLISYTISKRIMQKKEF